ncbi:MAG TPA: YcaO-like family protein [Thermoanaerobaculia bacterium]
MKPRRKRRADDEGLRNLAEALEVLLDPRFGVIRHVAEEPRREEFPEIFQYAAETCDTDAFSPRKAFGKTGGCSRRRSFALAKAVGEAVERYSAALYDDDALPDVSYAEADFPCVDPHDFALNSAAQYADPEFDWVPFEHDTRTRWVAARDLGSGATVHVPAAMVYVPYFYYLESDDPLICQPISTGLACHGTLEDAIARGLCEVIERDAFMITWQAGLARRRIRPDSLLPENAEILARLQAIGGSVTLFDLTMDNLVPVAMAVQTHPAPGMPALTVACAAALDPDDAVRKALEEVTHTARWMLYLKRDNPRIVPAPGFRQVDSQDNHLIFWAYHENLPLADFLFASTESVGFEELPNWTTGDRHRDLAVLCERIESTGHRALAVDITPTDIQDVGLSVARALIPGYHPLIMNHHYRALGGRRLWTIPQQLGFAGRRPEDGDIDVPHPFP